MQRGAPKAGSYREEHTVRSVEGSTEGRACRGEHPGLEEYSEMKVPTTNLTGNLAQGYSNL